MIPPHWASARLEDLADIQLGKMLDKNRTAGTSLRYLRNINVRWDHVDTSDLLEMPFKQSELARFGLRPGDVLVCEGGEPGRSAVWKLDDASIKYQKALHRVRLEGGILPRWLVFHLYFDSQRGALTQHLTGTTIKHLPKEAMSEYVVHVPPVQEQHRIVEAIESYFTRLDDAVATLERVQRNLKRYRASVLKAAVEGRLVPTEAELARAEGRNYEPATVLLERILAERRRRWEDNELLKMKAQGKTPKNEAWKAKYNKPAALNGENLPTLPEGWCWASLDQLAHLIRNGYSKQPASEGLVRILRISAIRPMRVDLQDSKWLPGSPANYAQDLISVGDLLFTRYNGNVDLVGVSGLVRSLDQPTVHPDKLIKVRLSDEVDPRYLEIATNTGLSRLFIENRTRTTAGQAGISGGDLRQMPIPLPPRAEQSAIACETDRLLTVCDSAMNAQAASLTRASRLRQSILKWAFEGRLVDQDPTDEPASVLLDRIKAERAAATTTTSNRKPRRKGNSANA